MKQTVNKTESVKPSVDEKATEAKMQQASKVEKSRLQKLKETKLFSRFLEASCDCV